MTFFIDFPNRFFSKMHGKVPMGSAKPTVIVAILRHFFRVTAVKEGYEVGSTLAQKHTEIKWDLPFFINETL